MGGVLFVCGRDRKADARGRGYQVGQGLRRGGYCWFRKVERTPYARGRGYRPGQGLRRGIQLRFREMAKTIAAGPELACGSDS